MSNLIGKVIGKTIGLAVSATNKLAEKGVQYIEAQQEKPVIKVNDFSHIISRLQIAQDSLRRDAAEFERAGGKVIFMPYRDSSVEAVIEKVSADAKLGLFTAMNELSAKAAEEELRKAEEHANKQVANAQASFSNEQMIAFAQSLLAQTQQGPVNSAPMQAPIIFQMPTPATTK